ncbi:hypothetical protein E6Q11_03450 [Candidatus Dojkabacteria bacterium]|uniref:Uncharacterized protein n=1 Tax=Candidatus Dojkabacteria bacterium TaxID=2099670 RepID=A0A5C7J695_9BACT|nr:MAG: hypothetical protein E6Q11_03450 [Candidatus Dojkabacteria bacterium]
MQITNTQQIVLEVSPKTNQGEPVLIDSITWAADPLEESDPNLVQIIPYPFDPNSFSHRAVIIPTSDALGEITIRAVADAIIGDGIEEIFTDFGIEIVGPRAATLETSVVAVEDSFLELFEQLLPDFRSTSWYTDNTMPIQWQIDFDQERGAMSVNSDPNKPLCVDFQEYLQNNFVFLLEAKVNYINLPSVHQVLSVTLEDSDSSSYQNVVISDDVNVGTYYKAFITDGNFDRLKVNVTVPNSNSGQCFVTSLKLWPISNALQQIEPPNTE